MTGMQGTLHLLHMGKQEKGRFRRLVVQLSGRRKQQPTYPLCGHGTVPYTPLAVQASSCSQMVVRMEGIT